MGPFRWVATFWTPTIDYRDYPANEVEDIAWEATTIGSRRGFFIGFLAGVLVIGGLAAAVVTTGLYRLSTPAPSPRPPDAAASQATQKELAALREENQTLRKQVADAPAAAPCAPCPPQVAAPTPLPRAAGPTPAPAQRTTTAPVTRRKASGAASADRIPLPIPSDCRQPGDCQ